jgi:hypothetical protein
MFHKKPHFTAKDAKVRKVPKVGASRRNKGLINSDASPIGLADKVVQVFEFLRVLCGSNAFLRLNINKLQLSLIY